ncbi:MAG: hypothetical protein BMS9Abin28_1955 [Anaerolineae bacterium]|nr:MAG: hypothetical protein BMS9Abin28_1955 [Anaerolineae bacterium]
MLASAAVANMDDAGDTAPESRCRAYPQGADSSSLQADKAEIIL